jgi:hypothetical protein
VSVGRQSRHRMLRGEGGSKPQWVPTRPADKIPTYNALDDPHCTAAKKRRFRAHCLRMEVWAAADEHEGKYGNRGADGPSAPRSGVPNPRHDPLVRALAAVTPPPDLSRERHRFRASLPSAGAGSGIAPRPTTAAAARRGAPNHARPAVLYIGNDDPERFLDDAERAVEPVVAMLANWHDVEAQFAAAWACMGAPVSKKATEAKQAKERAQNIAKLVESREKARSLQDQKRLEHREKLYAHWKQRREQREAKGHDAADSSDSPRKSSVSPSRTPRQVAAARKPVPGAHKEPAKQAQHAAPVRGETPATKAVLTPHCENTANPTTSRGDESATTRAGEQSPSQHPTPRDAKAGNPPSENVTAATTRVTAHEEKSASSPTTPREKPDIPRSDAKPATPRGEQTVSKPATPRDGKLATPRSEEPPSPRSEKAASKLSSPRVETPAGAVTSSDKLAADRTEKSTTPRAANSSQPATPRPPASHDENQRLRAIRSLRPSR